MPWPVNPAFVFIVTVVVIILVAVLAGKQQRLGVRNCKSCGETHPEFARFCRRCGHRL